MIHHLWTYTSDKITLLYRTIIRHGLEYTSPAWNPWLKTDTEKMEKVQRKCLNLGNEPIHMESLSFWRDFTDLVEIYKYLNGLYKKPVEEFFTNPRSIHFSRTDIQKHSFYQSCITKWNMLSEDRVQATSLDIFKWKLRANLTKYIN